MVARTLSLFPFRRRGPARTGTVVSIALGLLALCGGCGKEEPAAPAPSAGPGAGVSGDAASTPAPSRPGRGTAPVTVTGEEPYASSELGALRGTILFQGEVPQRFPLVSDSSPECKHHPEVDQRSNLIVVNDGKLANCYVALASGFDKARIPPVEAATVSLEQKGCMYVPRVLALRVGQTLRVTNDDPTTHNVHTRAKRNPETNRNMGAGQAPLEFRFERAESPVPFQCDIHPWMGAAVFVEEHPWFAVSDEQGAFFIRDVPPGEYVVEAIHESLGRVTGSVSVKAGVATAFTLGLSR